MNTTNLFPARETTNDPLQCPDSDATSQRTNKPFCDNIICYINPMDGSLEYIISVNHTN